jgi:hypothetical protein
MEVGWLLTTRRPDLEDEVEQQSDEPTQRFEKK